MTNAEIIVQALDDLLDHEVKLVLYGRAAIALGFEDAPDAVGRSLDVDVILSLSHAAALEADEQFWTAQEALNKLLEKQGLYLTHLFDETQVFLRPDWEQHLVAIECPSLRHLKLFRPATIDLILTKMMRGNDPQDMEDIAFLVAHDGITAAQMEEAFASVRIPAVDELREAFERALPLVQGLLS
jgi:hypothetical protein